MKKPIMLKSDLDDIIKELALTTNHKTLMIWACDCAERVLPYFEKNHPNDLRPRQAIAAGREWVKTGIFKMVNIRRGSLAAHAAARSVEDEDSARSAARAAGQALAAAHIPTHALAAAIYAATAVRDANPDDASAADNEREWQYRHLLEFK